MSAMVTIRATEFAVYNQKDRGELGFEHSFGDRRRKHSTTSRMMLVALEYRYDLYVRSTSYVDAISETPTLMSRSRKCR